MALLLFSASLESFIWLRQYYYLAVLYKYYCCHEGYCSYQQLMRNSFWCCLHFGFVFVIFLSFA